MPSQATSPESVELEKLQAEIARQQQTINDLRANGHVFNDAERHLAQLKKALAKLQE